jgi:hypothetical protein
MGCFMQWNGIGAFVMAGVVVAASCAKAEIVGQPASFGTGLTIEQAGQPVTLFHDDQMIDLVPVQFIQIAPGPFDILIEPMTCPPELDGLYIRFYDASILTAVVETVYAAADVVSFKDIMVTLFPPGYGFAADPGMLVNFLMDRPTDPSTEQGFNYVVDDRYAQRGASSDTVTVSSVTGNGRDYLGDGAPLVMLVGRNACASGDDRMLLDMIGVNLGAG